jgi:hypothetical protein
MREAAADLALSGGAGGKYISQRQCARQLLILPRLVV